MKPNAELEWEVDHARQITEVLGDLPLDAPDPVKAAKRMVDQELEELQRVASGRLSLGLAGAFSVGKTELVEVLTGCHNAFPRANRPTTGNIVSLLVRQTDEPAGSLEPGVVRFFNEADYLEAVRHVARSIDPKNLDVSLADVAAERVGGWRHLRHEAERLRNGSDRTRKRGAEELLLLLDADEEAAQELMGDPVPFTLAELDRYVDLGTSGWRQFPLVRRIEMTVHVPRTVWDLTEIIDRHELELVDLPGWGADRSNHRDSFLLRYELPRLHTLCVLVDCSSPGASIDSELIDALLAVEAAATDQDGDGARTGPMTEDEARSKLKSRLLVVASKFDHALDDRARTMASPSHALREHEVRELDTLGEILRHSRQLLFDDLPILTSAAAQHPGADPDLRLHIERAQATWGRIGARLAADGPTELSTSLMGFGHDGGVEEARRRLVGHVAERGIATIIADVRRARLRLDEAIDRLCTQIDVAPSSSPHEAENGLIEPVIQRLHGTQRLVQRAGHRPAVPGIELREALRERAAQRVASWPEWNEITAEMGDSWSDDAPLSALSVATGAHLLEPFVQLCCDIDDHSATLVAQAANSLVELVNRSVAPAMKPLHAAANEAQVATIDELQPFVADVAAANGDDVDSTSRRHRARFPLSVDRRLPWARNGGDPGVIDDGRRSVDIGRVRRELVRSAEDVGVEAAYRRWRGVVEQAHGWRTRSIATTTDVGRELASTEANSGDTKQAMRLVVDALRGVNERPASSGWESYF